MIYGWIISDFRFNAWHSPWPRQSRSNGSVPGGLENRSILPNQSRTNREMSHTSTVLSGDLEERPSQAAKVIQVPWLPTWPQATWAISCGLGGGARERHPKVILLEMPNLILVKPKDGTMNCFDFPPQFQQKETRGDSHRCV